MNVQSPLMQWLVIVLDEVVFRPLVWLLSRGGNK